MTVLEVIQRSTEFLARKGVESPRRNIEEMLARLLKLPRLQLYLNFEKQLGEGDLDALREMVKRRSLREPLQHILGSASFCGLELAVNSHALVPRPETELLAEAAIKHLRGRPSEGAAVLDFGTGTGCLAIAIAAAVPHACLHAVELSPEALALARQNAAAHQMEGRIQFHLGNGFAALPPALKFDLVVSNPPYIPNGEIDTLEPEVRLFDPRLALDGGADGLDFYRLLSREAGPWLTRDARMMVEFGDGQAGTVQEIFCAQNWVVEEVIEDYSRRPRILAGRMGP